MLISTTEAKLDGVFFCCKVYLYIYMYGLNLHIACLMCTSDVVYPCKSNNI